MLLIKKGREPNSLTEYKKQSNAYYDGCNKSNISDREALDYNNMLGVCLGNRGAGQANFTCDAHRGNATLTVNPFLKSSIDLIDYEDNGRICSTDLEINKDLDKTLNLNCEQVLLIANRKRTLKALKEYLSKLKSQGKWKKEFLEKIKKKYECPDENGKLEPYSGIVLYYLNKRIH